MHTNKRESVLFLHAGGQKTGSSALQSFLELNSGKLDDLGISYRNKAGVSFEHEISSGNGALLFNALCAPHIDGNDISEVVRSYFDGNGTAICSSEWFWTLTPEQWGRLVDACEQVGVRLRVIFYVRDVIPFVKSAYDQLIKRHGLYEDFEKWGETANWAHSEALRSMSGIIPPDEITVVSYEAIDKLVVDSFVELIGAKGLKRTGDPIVNRSLTQLERDILRKVNRYTGAVFSTELSDRMIYTTPYARSESLVVGEHVEKLLLDRHKDDIDWINQTFFGGDPVVSLGQQHRTSNINFGQVQREKASPNIDTNYEQRTHNLVLEWALEKLLAVRDSTIQKVTNALARIDWHMANDPAIPPSFDPIAYLLNNADLIEAGALPFAHFLSIGRYEAGRTLAWAEGAALAEVKNDFLKREQSFNEREKCLERERIRLDIEFTQLKLDSRMEVESLLRQQAAREQGYIEQLTNNVAAIDRERAALLEATEKKLDVTTNKHEKQVRGMEQELVSLRGELDQLRREADAQLRQQIAREQFFAEEQTRIREEFDRERMELVGAGDQKLAVAAENHTRYADEMAKELSSLRIQMDRQRDAVETLLRQMVELERQSGFELFKELEAMRATSSWRLTAPLRGFAGSVRRRHKTGAVPGANE